MSHRSPSRTRSHTPSCPDDPEEKDERRRAISRIQQDVERELENADRVLSTIDTFTGSRIPSRAGSQQRGSAGRQEDLGIAGQGRRSVSGFSDERPRKNSKEACPRSTAHSVAETGGVDSRGQGPSAARDEYDTGADGVDYDTHGGVYGGPGSPYGGAGGVGSGHGGAGGPGSPYGGAGGVGSGHGAAYGGPGSPYGGTGGIGSGHGGASGPDDPYGGMGGAGSGHGGAGGPGDPYGGMGGAGSGHGGAGGQVDPYGGMGGMGSGHGGAGGPGSPYGGAGGIGSGHGGAGGPGSPYGGAGGIGSGHGGAGGPGSPYGGAGGPGSPYGGAGGPGSPYGGAGGIGSGHGGAGGPGSPYGGAGGPGDPYDGAGGGYAGPGDSYGAQGGYLENEDPYAMSKSSGGPASAARSRDQSKMAYDQERTASGMPYESGSSAGYGSRGKSPPSVHYSPSTALSARGESPSKFQGSGHPSGSGFNGNRSPTETQYSASRVQSRPGYDASRDPSGYERGGSQTVPKGQSGLIGADSGYGEGTDARGYEGAGSRTFTAGGSRGSPGRSVKGPSPNASRGTGVLGAVDQSLINNNVCPAAVQGKCPAFARDSSAFARNRSAAGSGTSASKRTLGRIEEGLPSEEMAADGARGQEEDFRPLSGGMHSPLQVGGGGGYTPCPPPLPRRTHYSGVPEQPVYQSPASRSPAMGLAQPSIPSRPTVQYENQHQHHHHHDHDHDHDHDGEGFLGKPVPERDENATLALNRLSQIKQTPSYLKCKPDRGIDLSSCDQSTKGAPKVVKFPEKPCKGIEELQDMIDCETRDVESAWYLTSDEKKTYKKPCPKQQKAQENVKSIIKAQTPQSCSKEYSPLEHPDPDDITPELAASMMFSQEQGIKLNECPDEAIKRLFPDIPRPPFPVKLSSVHIVDSNKEDQEEIIEKSASVPSEGVSDSAYTRTMQNKGEGMGVQKSYDIDFAVGAEKREYVLVAEKPRRYNKVQFRGNLPSWFPGYMEAFPQSQPGIKLVESPSRVFQKAWTSTNPEKLPSSDIIVLD